MKPCPFCAEAIQDAAVVCRFCGRALAAIDAPTAPATPPPSRALLTTAKVAGGCGLVALIFMGGCFVLAAVGLLLPSGPAPSSVSQTPPSNSLPAKAARTTADAVLEILAKRGYSESGYHIVEGQVKNLTGRSLERLQVVTTWYTASGQFITSDSAMVDYQPLLAGQTSPFKTMSSTNPAMSRFTVAFKPIFGTELQTKDSSK